MSCERWIVTVCCDTAKDLERYFKGTGLLFCITALGAAILMPFLGILSSGQTQIDCALSTQSIKENQMPCSRDLVNICERWFCWILLDSLRFLHMRSRSTNYGRLPEVTPKDEAGIYPPPTKQLACTSQDFLVFHWQAMSHSTTKLIKTDGASKFTGWGFCFA